MRMDVAELNLQLVTAALGRVAPTEAVDPDVVGFVLTELERRPERYDAEPGLLLKNRGGDLAGAGIGEVTALLLPYVAVAAKLTVEHLIDLGADSAAHKTAGFLSRVFRKRRPREVQTGVWNAQRLEAARAHVEQLAAAWDLSPQEKTRCLLAVFDTVETLFPAEPAPNT